MVPLPPDLCDLTSLFSSCLESVPSDSDDFATESSRASRNERTVNLSAVERDVLGTALTLHGHRIKNQYQLKTVPMLNHENYILYSLIGLFIFI